MRNSKISSFRHYRLLLFALLIAAGVFLWQDPPVWLRHTITLVLSKDPGATIEYLRSFGLYGMVVTFFIIVFINITAVLPNIFILAAAGILYGVLPGTLIAWLAESLGTIISFFLLRYFFKDYAHRLIMKSKALSQVDEYSGKNGLKLMVMARAIPFIPSGLITALGAFSQITVRDYILATLIGKLPSALIEVTLGHDLASYHENMTRLSLVLAFSIALYIYYWRHSRKTRKKDAPLSTPEKDTSTHS